MEKNCIVPDDISKMNSLKDNFGKTIDFMEINKKFIEPFYSIDPTFPYRNNKFYPIENSIQEKGIIPCTNLDNIPKCLWGYKLTFFFKNKYGDFICRTLFLNVVNGKVQLSSHVNENYKLVGYTEDTSIFE